MPEGKATTVFAFENYPVATAGLVRIIETIRVMGISLSVLTGICITYFLLSAIISLGISTL